MDSHGFVYCLENFSIPGYYKIGYTTKSPHLRALELSKATGVIGEFFVVCYIDVCEPYSVEQFFHKELSKFRNDSRKEFFKTDLSEIVPYFWFHPNKYGFIDINAASTLCKNFDSLKNPYEECFLTDFERQMYWNNKIYSLISDIPEDGPNNKEQTFALVSGFVGHQYEINHKVNDDLFEVGKYLSDWNKKGGRMYE